MAAALPVACSLGDRELRARREALLGGVLGAVEEVRRVRGGLALRFPPDGNTLGELAALVALERECCRFLRFRLTAEPDRGAVWLEMTGPRGTTRFLREELGIAARSD